MNGKNIMRMFILRAFARSHENHSDFVSGWRGDIIRQANKPCLMVLIRHGFIPLHGLRELTLELFPASFLIIGF
jgi:hypothetical protein